MAKRGKKPAAPAATCTDCAEPAVTTCVRCLVPVCGFHGPFKDGYPCRQCEARWAAGAAQRRWQVLPIALGALGVSAALFAGATELLRQVAAEVQIARIGALGALLVGPLLTAWAAARWAQRRLRRKYLAERPPDVAGDGAAS